MQRAEREHCKKVILGLVDTCKQAERWASNTSLRKGIFLSTAMAHREYAFKWLLQGGFSYGEIRALLDRCEKDGFYPIEDAQSYSCRVINFTVRHPIVAYILSKPYRYVFVPYIKPWLRRN